MIHDEGEVCVTHGWWERFCQGHPDFSLRSASVLTHSQAKGASPEALNEYFDVLEYTLGQYDIQNEPGCIFNLMKLACLWTLRVCE